MKLTAKIRFLHSFQDVGIHAGSTTRVEFEYDSQDVDEMEIIESVNFELEEKYGMHFSEADDYYIRNMRDIVEDIKYTDEV